MSFKTTFMKVFDAYRNNGTRPDLPATENIAIQNSNLTLGLAWMTVTSYVPIDIIAGDWSMLFLHGITSLGYVICYFLIGSRSPAWGITIAFFVANATVCFNVDALGKENLTQYYYLIAAVQPFLCFTRRHTKLMLYCVAFGAIGWVYSHAAPVHILMPPALRPDLYTVWAPIISTPAFVIFVFYQTFRLYYQLIDRTEKQGAELVHSSRLAAVGEMAGGVAHEINTPLATISTSLAMVDMMLDMENTDKEMIRARLKTAEKTVTRISKITQGLLTYSRGDRGENKTDKVAVKDPVELVVNLSSEKFENGHVNLQVDLKDDTTELKWNTTELSQVFLNLLNNAFDAIQDNPEKWVKLRGFRANETYRFEIIDSGKGIPPQVVEKMMNPFFTTKEIGKGTGLGLSVSKGLVESRGGRLFYELNGGNTSFVVEVPLALAAA